MGEADNVTHWRLGGGGTIIAAAAVTTVAAVTTAVAVELSCNSGCRCSCCISCLTTDVSACFHCCYRSVTRDTPAAAERYKHESLQGQQQFGHCSLHAHMQPVRIVVMHILLLSAYKEGVRKCAH